MTSAIIEQLKLSSDDAKRKELLQTLTKTLFLAPGQPLDPTFAQGDFLLLCGLQSEESPLVSTWLLHNLSDLCRRDDVCTNVEQDKLD
jgi:hypothetical protein